MLQFYVVKGLGPGFDGLFVEGENADGIVDVTKLIDRNSILGDRNVSLPIPLGTMFLSEDVLEQIEDPGTLEFASNNPYGKFELEGEMTCGNLKVVYAQFERSLQVTILELVGYRNASTPDYKTAFSGNFTRRFDLVKQEIEKSLKQGSDEAEQLLFRLRELQAEDAKNG